MVGVLIVSHSKKAAEGIYELAVQMAGKDHRVVAVGGMEDGSIGTDFCLRRPANARKRRLSVSLPGE